MIAAFDTHALWQMALGMGGVVLIVVIILLMLLLSLVIDIENSVELVHVVVEVFLRTAAASRDDGALLDELVGHFHAGGQQSARVAAEVHDQALHALAVQLPQRRVEIAAGRLLEASQLEVANPELGVDDPHVVDARHVDMLAAYDQVRAVDRCGGDDQVDQASFRALQQVGGLIGIQIVGRMSADGW